MRYAQKKFLAEFRPASESAVTASLRILSPMASISGVLNCLFNRACRRGNAKVCLSALYKSSSA